jgi:GMP synthase (glutamine-hydrolysing)
VTQDNLQARPVVVVDFGAQYAQLIARRVREANCFSEVVPSTMPVGELLAKDPAAIILSGGPSSVYEEGAPSLDPALLEAGVPVFGMCYGFQSMAQALGGSVEKTGLSEFGATQAMVSDTTSTLFNGQPDEQSVWMSHGDSVAVAPEGMRVTATTAGAPVAAFEDDARRLYGVQWHPEVMHSTFGQQVLENFLRRGAGSPATGPRPMSSKNSSSRCAARSVRRGSSVASPVAWTPRWRLPSSSARSVTS